MTWEDTIINIQNDPEYKQLVENAYLGTDLQENIENYARSPEFKEILKLIKSHQPNCKHILDVGSGNGITAINFARTGFQVSALEPDPSNMVGRGAIQKLASVFKLKNIEIYPDCAEDFRTDKTFDVVIARQALHHARELDKFVKNITRYLKKGGILMTIRDHVIYNDNDKNIFLNSHPLHKFYGGENAFTVEEYRSAMTNAKLDIIAEYKFFDSSINYYPFSLEDLLEQKKSEETSIKNNLVKNLGFLGKSKLIYTLYKKLKYDPESIFDERNVPGRMYSYICKKT